jgi:hypothetical protein
MKIDAYDFRKLLNTLTAKTVNTGQLCLPPKSDNMKYVAKLKWTVLIEFLFSEASVKIRVQEKSDVPIFKVNTL